MTLLSLCHDAKPAVPPFWKGWSTDKLLTTFWEQRYKNPKCDVRVTNEGRHMNPMCGVLLEPAGCLFSNTTTLPCEQVLFLQGWCGKYWWASVFCPLLLITWHYHHVLIVPGKRIETVSCGLPSLSCLKRLTPWVCEAMETKEVKHIAQITPQLPL